MIYGRDVCLSEWFLEPLRSVEFAPVDPRAAQGLPFNELVVAMKTSPVAWVRDKALFNRVLRDVFEDVSQRLFINDLLVEVNPLPKAMIPIINLTKLTREVGVDPF